MDQDGIRRYVTAAFPEAEAMIGSQEAGSPEVSWGDTFFFYQPDKRFPFATIVTKDYAGFDSASQLDRPGVFRLNVGVSGETFRTLFPEQREWDFAALDRVMPHPAYGRQHWLCVLNPSDGTFEAVKPLLAEAYELAVQRHRKKD